MDVPETITADPDSAHPLLCPSARCEEGAILLGIVGGDGVVGYVFPPMEIDAGFVAKAREGRTPEKRFRFASRCAENDCVHWNQGRCGVIDTALAFISEQDEIPTVGTLRPCSIRHSCRWFAQIGPAACAACPLIVTEPA